MSRNVIRFLIEKKKKARSSKLTEIRAGSKYQGLAVLIYKVVRRFGPRWQLDVVHRLFGGLQNAEVQPVHVDQKLWLAKELGYELFDVVRVVHEHAPRRVERVKLAVGHVETAALQLDVKRRKRFRSHQIMQNARCIRIVRAVVELGNGS